MKLAVSRLITAAISLIAVITMFVGATFAWFNAYDNANEATSGNFTIENTAQATPDLVILSDDSDITSILDSFFASETAIPEAAVVSTGARINDLTGITSATDDLGKPLSQDLYLYNASGDAITKVNLKVTISTNDFDALKDIVNIAVAANTSAETASLQFPASKTNTFSLAELGFTAGSSSGNTVDFQINLPSFAIAGVTEVITIYLWLDGTKTNLDTIGDISFEFEFSKGTW